MSEKRFTETQRNCYYTSLVFDNQTQEELGTPKVVVLLNMFEDDVQIKDKKIEEQQDTIRKLQDLCGESDSENAKLRIENKKLQAENEQLKNLVNACEYGQKSLMKEMKNNDETLDKIWEIMKELYGVIEDE